jgi:hypothetical protein
MAYDAAWFLTKRPEFSTVGNSNIIQAVLDESIINCTSAVFGNRLEEAIIKRTAYELACNPSGKGIKWAGNNSGSDGYKRLWDELKRAAAAGRRFF